MEKWPAWLRPAMERHKAFPYQFLSDDAERYMDITQLLAFTVKNNASELHLSAGLPPMIRVDGDIHRINMPDIDNKQMAELIYSTMNDQQRRDYESDLEVDFSYFVPGLARLCVNAFHHHRGLGGAFLVIPSEMRTLDELEVSAVV